MTADLDVAARLVELEQLDRASLCKAWKRKFGKAPPHYTSMGFMRKVFLWEEQSAVAGGIPPYLMRALKTAATDRVVPASASHDLKPGALLIREWNGRSYQVEVTSEGFQFDGREYRSLSAISRKITGTTWSGPRFFGLVPSRGQQK